VAVLSAAEHLRVPLFVGGAAGRVVAVVQLLELRYCCFVCVFEFWQECTVVQRVHRGKTHIVEVCVINKRRLRCSYVTYGMLQ
jgi:polyferredoxin